jgi:hypothetical protein
LGHLPLPDTPHGNPITYLHDGKQYLVVSVGGGPFFSVTPEDLGADINSDTAKAILASQPKETHPELVAFRLP